jgi:hypothetical protein
VQIVLLVYSPEQINFKRCQSILFSSKHKNKSILYHQASIRDFEGLTCCAVEDKSQRAAIDKSSLLTSVVIDNEENLDKYEAIVIIVLAEIENADEPNALAAIVDAADRSMFLIANSQQYYMELMLNRKNRSEFEEFWAVYSHNCATILQTSSIDNQRFVIFDNDNDACSGEMMSFIENWTSIDTFFSTLSFQKALSCISRRPNIRDNEFVRDMIGKTKGRYKSELNALKPFWSHVLKQEADNDVKVASVIIDIYRHYMTLNSEQKVIFKEHLSAVRDNETDSFYTLLIQYGVRICEKSIELKE